MIATVTFMNIGTAQLTLERKHYTWVSSAYDLSFLFFAGCWLSAREDGV